MKSSSIWSAFGVISLFFASCGKDEPSADKSKQDQNLSQADQSPSYDPKTDSSDLRPTSDRGATPMDGEKHQQFRLFPKANCCTTTTSHQQFRLFPKANCWTPLDALC